jgi:hypothetical protein
VLSGQGLCTWPAAKHTKPQISSAAASPRIRSNRVRFTTTVPTGSRVRPRLKPAKVEPVERYHQDFCLPWSADL